MAAHKPTPDDFGQFAPSGYTINSDSVRVFGGFWAPEPETVFETEAAVTHDAVISPDGEVSIELNGVPLSEVGERSGSYVR